MLLGFLRLASKLLTSMKVNVCGKIDLLAPEIYLDNFDQARIKCNQTFRGQTYRRTKF